MAKLISALGLFLLGLFLPFILVVLWISIGAGIYWGLLVVLLLFVGISLVLRMVFFSPIGWLFLGFLVLGIILVWKTRSKLVAIIMGFIAGLPLAFIALLLVAATGCAASGC